MIVLNEDERMGAHEDEIAKLPQAPSTVTEFGTLLGALLSQPGAVAGQARARIGNPFVEMAALPPSPEWNEKLMLRVQIPNGLRFIVAIGEDK